MHKLLRPSISGLAFAMLAVSVACTQQPAWQPPAGHLTIDLWPHGAPGATPNPPAEVDTTTVKDILIAGARLVRLSNVSNPTLTLYVPKDHPSGAAIIVFPGGGYRILAIELEGTEVCDWLVSIRVACILVKYRVPNSGPLPKSSAALQDAQRALGMVRAHAAEWHIDPQRIGVLGFCRHCLSRLPGSRRTEFCPQSGNSRHRANSAVLHRSDGR